MLGPIFAVELVTASRRRVRQYGMRLLYGLALFCTLLVNYSVFRDSGLGGDFAITNFAAYFFDTFAWVQLIAVLLVGPGMIAGGIAMERERRTIEYLFATDLRNSEIILGKFFARLIQLGCLVLVGLPILAFAQLLGGIQPEAVLLVFALTLSTMVAVGSLALAISVWAKRARDAIVRCYVALIGMLAIPPLLAATMEAIIASSGFGNTTPVDVCDLIFVVGGALALLVLVGGAFYRASRTRRPGRRAWLLIQAFALLAIGAGLQVWWQLTPAHLRVGPTQAVSFAAQAVNLANPLWVLAQMQWTVALQGQDVVLRIVGMMLAAHLATTVVFLTLATVAVRRVHLSGIDKPVRRWIDRFRLPSLRPGIGNHPIIWKETFVRSRGAGSLLMNLIAGGLIVLIFGWLGFFWLYTLSDISTNWRREEFQGISIAVLVLVQSAGLLFVGARAAGSITSEKERDTWISLLATPLSPWEIVVGKMIGVIATLRGLLLLMIAIYAMNLVVSPLYLLPIPFQVGTFLVLAASVAGLGIAFSLRLGNSLKAIAATLSILLAVGGGYLFCCMPVFVIGGGDEEVLVFFAPCMPYLLTFPPLVHMTEGEVLEESEGALAAFAYIVGLGGYVMAAFVLFNINVFDFDRVVGRPRTWSFGGGPRGPHSAARPPDARRLGERPPPSSPPEGEG